MNRVTPPTSSVDRLLLATAFSGPDTDFDELIRECDDWASLLEKAGRHHLLTSLAVRGAGHPSIAEDVSRTLEKIKSETTYRDRMTVLTLSEILEALGRVDIQPILIKGQSLSERLYDHPEERWAKDIDLLIPSDRLNDADHVLCDIGFIRVNPEHYREYHFHLPYCRPTGRAGQYLEIHWDLTPKSSPVQFTPQSWFKVAQTHTLRAGRLLLPPPQEELRHLSWHALNGGTLTLRDTSEVLQLHSLLSEHERESIDDSFVKAIVAVGRSLWSETGKELLPPLTERRWLSRAMLSSSTVLEIGNVRWAALRSVCYWSLLRPESAGLEFLFRDSLESIEQDRRRDGSQVGFREAVRITLGLLLALAACIVTDRPDALPTSASQRTHG